MTKKKRGAPSKPISQQAHEDLGKVPDEVLAQREGVSIWVISKFRRQKGIIYKSAMPSSVPDDIIAMLGKASDNSLVNLCAERGITITKQRLHQIRKSRGIPSYTSTLIGDKK